MVSTASLATKLVESHTKFNATAGMEKSAMITGISNFCPLIAYARRAKSTESNNVLVIM